MAGLSFHDRLHIQKILAQQGYLQSMFSEFIRKVSPELTKMAQTGNPNVWIRNVRIEANIDRYLIDFTDQLTHHITNMQSDAWARATFKSDALVKEYIKGMAIDSTTKQGMFNRNVEAFKAFANRTKNGITLSEQIWDIAKETKTQLEFYVGSGISVGRSATRISQDIRQLLNDPDTQFRRVRNDEGKLIPSKPMKDYHPGQGIYKSPYKNAIRLAVTETNMAYRAADHERWNQLDFVVGVKIQRSGNGEPCKICDPLVGDYPKGFKFVGWHPHCICFATPIMLDQDDFLDFQLTDKIPESAIVTSIPKQAEEYINKIAPKVENWKNKPYWIRDNYVDGDVKKGFIDPCIKPTPNLSVKGIKPLSAMEQNVFDVESKLSITKGPEMDFDKANELKGNIHYGEGMAYSINCQSCVVSNELRRRGYDVTAFGNFKKADSIPTKLSYKTEWAWIDPVTGKMPIKSRAGGIKGYSKSGRVMSKSIKELEKEFAELIKSEGRYHIDFGWKGQRSGHIITLEKLSNGKVRIYDPQNGKIVEWNKLKKEISLRYGVGVLRVDNLKINAEIINGIVTKL